MPKSLFLKTVSFSGGLFLSTSTWAACQQLSPIITEKLGIDSSGCIVNGLATITNDKGKMGVVNQRGDSVIPVRYDTVNLPTENNYLASVCLYDKCGFMNTQTGKLVIPMRYADYNKDSENAPTAYEFKNGFAVVAITENDKTKFGAIDLQGNTVIPFIYDYAENFNEGLALVNLNDKWGFINSANQKIIPLLYNAAGNFHNGLAPVLLGETWGFVDKQNKTVIPFQYDYAETFSEGLAAVGKKDSKDNIKIGYINPRGEVVIPFRFNSIEEDGANASFNDGKAYVSLGEINGTIDRNGRFTPDTNTDAK